MRHYLFFLLSLVIFSSPVFAGNSGGTFRVETVVDHFPVSDQGSTGTCWSFATTSFLESEIIRKGYPATDLSEMFFVYHTYKNRALRYILFHGNNNHGQGGQAHDVIDVLRTYGMAVQEAFPGVENNGRHNHLQLASEVFEAAKALSKKRGGFNADELYTFDDILEKHLGEVPERFVHKGEEVSPLEFRDRFDINPDDYIELTSYSHHPYYEPFVLEVPDNWAHKAYYNLPLEELMEVMFHSIEKGYSFAWDGDTSERTFSHKKGKAELPDDINGRVDQEMRQQTFYDRTTTDDHLMHVVGVSRDDKGNRMFYTKNSWGAGSNDFNGYLHMSEDYVRLKTVAVLVNKESIPVHIREKLRL